LIKLVLLATDQLLRLKKGIKKRKERNIEDQT